MPNPRPINAMAPATTAATTIVTTYPVSLDADANVEAKEEVAYILKHACTVEDAVSKHCMTVLRLGLYYFRGGACLSCGFRP